MQRSTWLTSTSLVAKMASLGIYHKPCTGIGKRPSWAITRRKKKPITWKPSYCACKTHTVIWNNSYVLASVCCSAQANSCGYGSEPNAVYLLGGTSQISTSISNAIARMGYQVQRVTKPFTAQAGTQDYRANRNVSFVAVDQANPLDDLIGTDFAQSYVTPMINVGGGSSLPTSAAGWIAQAGGWVTATALFAPAPADAALSTAISGIEAGPFGTTFVADPAKPFGEN